LKNGPCVCGFDVCGCCVGCCCAWFGLQKNWPLFSGTGVVPDGHWLALFTVCAQAWDPAVAMNSMPTTAATPRRTPVQPPSAVDELLKGHISTPRFPQVRGG